MIQVMFIVAWLAASFSVATPNHHIPLVAVHSLEASHSLEAAHSLKAAHSPVVTHSQKDNLPEFNSKQVYRYSHLKKNKFVHFPSFFYFQRNDANGIKRKYGAGKGYQKTT